jgi:hypothetical protein
MRRKTTVSFLFFRERDSENEKSKKEQKPSQKELQAFKG